MPRPATMLRQSSRLVPFEEPVQSELIISAELVWISDGWLDLSFGVLSMTGSGLAELTIPRGLVDGIQPTGEHRDGLWNSTCFEAFLAIPNQSIYWEINLVPEGNWAVYGFDSYRNGQRRETMKESPLIWVQRWKHQLRLDARLPITPWWPSGLCPDLALSAVLDRGQRGLSHWAISHNSLNADFHNLESFLKV